MKLSPPVTKKSIKEFAVATAVFISRLGILPANLSPLGSFGFFVNPFLFGASIIIFDLFVKGIYPGFLFTYLGFAMYPILGRLTRTHLHYQLLAIPVASFMFFLISNLGVWWYWYDHTLEKLLLCYALAVPFYMRTLSGDMVFGYGFLLFKQRNELTLKLPSLASLNY